MPRNNALIDVGIRINTKDVDDILSKLSQSFDNLGNNANISSNFKKQIEDMIKQVADLQTKISNLQKTNVSRVEFVNIKTDILEQVSAIEQRTTMLESAMSNLVKTMSSADGGAMTSMLEQLRSNMDQTASSASGLINTIGTIVSSVGDNTNISIIDNQALESSMQALKDLLTRLKDIDELDYTAKPINVIDEKDFKRQLSNAKAEYDKLLEAFYKTPQDINIVSQLATAAERVEDFVNSSFKAFGNNTSIRNYVDNLAGDVQDTFSKVVETANTNIALIERKIKNTSSAQIGYSPQAKNGGGYNIPIDISTTGAGLASKAIKIIEQAQTSVDGHPIEVELQLISPSQTKKSSALLNKSLKEFQKQVNNISDDATRDRMNEVLVNIQKGFASQISVNLVSSISDAAKAMRFILTDLKNEIKNNPVVINPSLEFTEEEINKIQKQVEDISENLSKKLSEAVKSGYVEDEQTQDDKKDKKKKNTQQTEFRKLEKQLNNIIDDITAIPDKLEETTNALPDSLNKVGESLLELLEKFKSLDELDMGRTNLEGLRQEIEKAKDSISELLNVFSGAQNVNEMLSDWDESDDIMRHYYGDKHLLERGAYIFPDGRIVGKYTYGDDGSIKNMSNKTYKGSIGVHSHGSDRVTFGSLFNDGGGDLNAFIYEYLQNGIEKQLIAARNDIEVWDVKGLYDKYYGKKIKPINGVDTIDFSKDFYNALSKHASNILFEDEIEKYIPDFLDRFGTTNFSDSLKNIFNSILSGTSKLDKETANGLGLSPEMYDEIIDKIRTGIEKSDINSGFESAFKGVNEYIVGELASRFYNFVDQNVNSRDLSMYQHQRVRGRVLSDFGITDSEKYIQNYTKDEFERLNPLNLKSNAFAEIFKNTGIEEFTNNLSKIIDPLKTLSETLFSMGNISESLFKNGFDGASTFTKEIEDISTNLRELLNLYKQLNTNINTSQLADSLKGWSSSTDLDRFTSETLNRYFGNDSAEFVNLLNDTKPNKVDLSADDYLEWSNAVASAANTAGIALDKFRSEQKTIQDIEVNFNTEAFDKLVQNSTTLKNSLNSLRKESDFDGIISAVDRLGATLLEFSEVVQKSTGILSASKLNEQFSEIQNAAQKLDGVKFNTKAGKRGAQSIIDMYRQYKGAGGELSLNDIGGSKNLQKYIAKHINDTAEQSAASTEKEAGALRDVEPAAIAAAEAKTSFADANRALFDSIVSSISGLDNEGKAFKNINNLLNNIGGKNGDEKLEKTKRALQELITILNSDVGENSLIKSLENMALTGDSLKDLAEVLKATKKQIERAQGSIGIKSGIPEFDYAQDKLNNDEEALQKAGRDYLSQFGLVLNSTLKTNRDGLLEYTGLVKNANNELKQFVFTSPDGKHFNIQSESTNTPQAMKQALQYEKIRKAWERMQAKDPNMTDEVVFRPDVIEKDKEAYEEMIGVAQSYINEIGNIQKVTRQVRQDSAGNLLESFSFHGDKGHITMGRDGGIVASHQDLENMEDVKVAYSELYNTAKNYYELKMKAASGKATPYEINQLQEIEKEYDSLLEKIDKFNKLYGGNNIGVDALNAYRNDIGKQFDDYLQKSQDTYDKRVKTVEQTRINQRNDYTPEYRAQLDEVVNLWKRINELRDQHTDGKAWNIDELRDVGDNLQKIDQIYDGLKDKRNILAKTSDIDNLISKASRDLTQNSLSPDLAGRYRELISDLQQVRVSGEDAAQGLGQIDQVTLGRFQDRLKELNAELMRTGQNGKGFWKQFSGAITSKSANFLAQYFSLQDLIRYGREISQTVITIDSANTELKKVTDESNTRIQHSFTESAKTAQELGATISEVINSTADWARLGYNIDEAEELARVTTLYQTVGDNMSQETASQSLVSMLQGFHIDASEAERVVDSVNEVANNFAIDTAGIGEALQRSAAAFNAAGTDLNKSIALVTTANAVVQNPETVGTMFKTNFVFMYSNMHIEHI